MQICLLIMNSKGYQVVDVTSQFESQKIMKQGYVALNKNTTYQIEFFELNNCRKGLSLLRVNKASLLHKNNPWQFSALFLFFFALILLFLLFY